jgi:hypothetical protein
LKSRGLSGLVAIGFLGPREAWSSPGGSGEPRRASGTHQELQGRPRSSSEMSSVSFTKIGFFGPGRRLAAPEGPKIAGGAALARRENLSRSRAPARSSFYAFPFCAIEASFWMICISVRLQGPASLRRFSPSCQRSWENQDFFLSPLSRKGASFYVIKVFLFALSRPTYG